MNIFISYRKLYSLSQLLYNNEYKNIFICLFIMKAKPTERKCKDCELIIPYIPRKIRCINCYKKYINHATKFINDE